MEVMSAIWLSSWLASVSILPKTTSWCSSLLASKVGAKALQGPHQSAHQSRITISLPWMVCWKFSKVTFIVGIQKF